MFRSSSVASYSNTRNSFSLFGSSSASTTPTFAFPSCSSSSSTPSPFGFATSSSSSSSSSASSTPSPFSFATASSSSSSSAFASFYWGSSAASSTSNVLEIKNANDPSPCFILVGDQRQSSSSPPPQMKTNETVAISDAFSSAAAADDAAKHNTTNQREAVEETFSFNVAVENKNNRVVFAEFNNDFIDVVFSFLTLPIGCILSLLHGKSPTVSIGCMNNLYASVTNLDARDFMTEACKDMLLHPRISSEAQCRKLKLKYDENLETLKCFYFCQNLECRREGRAKLSEIPNAHCHWCGQLMDQLATLSEKGGYLTCGEEGGVFMKGGSNLFLVTDNMQVMPGLGLLSIELLKKLGITDANELEIRSVAVRPEKVLQLLGLSIISRTPLTNWILSEQDSSAFTEVKQERSTMTSDGHYKADCSCVLTEVKQERSTMTSDGHYKADCSRVLTKVEQESSHETFDKHSETSGSHVLNKVEQESTTETFNNKVEQESTTETSNGHSETNESQKIKLVLFFSKSQNAVLYAECDEDFVNFLFSFLTFPLGSVLKILDGNSQLGSFDNLYRSVTDLNINGQLKSEELKDMLLCPKLAPFFACDNQLLQIEESCHPEYKLWATGNDPKIEWFVEPASTKPKLFTFGERIDLLSVTNPRSPAGESKQGQGFVKGPAKFMVTDDLTVTLFSPTKSLSVIGKSNVPITDIDAISVDFGVEEAKCLLRAALISKTALTDVLISMQAKCLLRAALISKTTLTDVFKENTSSNIFRVRIEECEDW